MLDKLKSMWIAIIGDPGITGSERYFVRTACFVASIFLFILCVIHIIMNLKPAPVFYAGGSALVLLGLYFFVRFRSYLFFPKLILSIFGLIMLDFTWYSKFLSNGPVLLYIMIFGALLLWVWDGKWLVFLLGIYFINIVTLFIIEKFSAESLLLYPDPVIRRIDIYLSLTIYSMLLISLLYIVKREFIRQREQALKSEKLKSAFLSNMSHEIRTPLNAIVGFSQLLNESFDEQNKQLYVSAIQQSSDQLLHLIDNILVLSKIEAGQFEIQNKVFSLKELFIELENTFSIIALKKNKSNIQIKYDLEVDDIMLNTDPFRLKQVLSNLIENAIKFTSQGSIIFSCSEKNNRLLFSVKDTGIGIPEKDLKIIFDRFARFDYQGINPGGSGIGLSIAKEVINTLNGKMWVESIVGKGSTFSFCLPSTIITELFVKKDISGIKVEPSASTISKPILVVEDDPSSIIIVKEILATKNIKIHHVTDGYEAIEFIKKDPDIRLILMDLMLPKLNGYEATKIIKQIKPNIPIIVQTAYAMDSEREKALNAGCDDYITKPYNIQHFIDIILKYLK